MATNGIHSGQANGSGNGVTGTNGVNGVNGVNGARNSANGTNGHASNSSRSRLRPVQVDEVQDLICVGFGPASLAVAIALHDALENQQLATAPRVLFLEKQQRFAWHAGMLLPGAKMQISFVKDLATLRDPRSTFTFLNYLHENGRLVEFTNLDTFLPARVEYEDYLRWCAGFFDDAVVYGEEVVSVAAETVSSGVKTFTVTSRDNTGVHTFRARNVLMALGGKPSLPACLPQKHPRVIHSSQYAHLVPQILSDRNAPYRVAVVGAGQSAAEIFNNIQVLYPQSKTSLVMRSEFLKPSDDSPFVNSIFNPSFIDELYPRPAKYRKDFLTEARATNYGVVRLNLIETLYERLYHQRRVLGPDESQWPHRILGGRRVVRVDGDVHELPLKMIVEPDIDDDEAAAASSLREELDVDLVIAATGYKRNAHVDMLHDLWPLLPDAAAKGGNKAADDALYQTGSWPVQVGSGDDATTTTTKQDKILAVGRDYRVQFAPGNVAEGSGVWLQGCCEGTHGLSDTLLSVLATRSGEIVESILARSIDDLASNRSGVMPHPLSLSAPHPQDDDMLI